MAQDGFSGFPLVAQSPSVRPVHAVRPGEIETFLTALTAAQAAFLLDSGFKARMGDLVILSHEIKNAFS